jgi:Rps23 Pro-64 3,4-dihydroxylase Tpa1-like proline 4-hydroxylase
MAIKIGEREFRHLCRFGYAIIDSAIPTQVAREIHREIVQLERNRLLFKNSTRLVKGNRIDAIEKAGIWEQELSDQRIREIMPVLDDLRKENSIMSQLNTHSGGLLDLVRQDIKVQVNTGQGGCFPMHSDSDGKVDDRLITAITYLNEDWKDGDGGELRLYPFPFEHVDIRPIFARMVIFSSVHMLHRVLPSNKTRYCFTNWLSGRIQRTRKPLSSADLNNEFQIENEILTRPDLRLLLAKVVYAREWSDSICESHPPSHSLDSALEQHWKDIGTISQALHEYIPFVSQKYPCHEDYFEENREIAWL